MKTIVRLLIVGIVLAAASIAASAQTTPAPAPSPVTFTVMAWDMFDPDNDLELNYPSGGKLRTMRAAWRDRSPAMECDGPGPLVFSRTIERDGQKTEQPVATAIIPEGVTRALLVFGRAPGPDIAGGPAVRVMVIDDSYAVFPGQSVRFMNYTGMTLGGVLGERTFEVAPGRDQVVPASLPETNRLLPFKLAKRDAAGGWRRLRSSGLPMSARLRVLVFVTEEGSGGAGRPQLVIVRDQVEAPTVLAATGRAGRQG